MSKNIIEMTSETQQVEFICSIAYKISQKYKKSTLLT